jgi:hypothetical protein
VNTVNKIKQSLVTVFTLVLVLSSGFSTFASLVAFDPLSADLNDARGNANTVSRCFLPVMKNDLASEVQDSLILNARPVGSGKGEQEPEMRNFR